MDPKLDSILKQAYSDMEAKNIPVDQRKSLIEKLANDYQASQGSGGTSEEKPGFVQGVIQNVARPFLKPAASFAAGAASLINPEAGQKAREEGVPFGYFGKVKPFGAYDGTTPTLGDVGRGSADVAGNALEAASYFMAPLKIGRGFWATAKEVGPMAATFGAGKGLEAAGQGKGAGEAVIEGGLNAVGAAAGYGLLKGGANLFANWGARALQTEAVRTAGSWMKDFAERTWTSLPEAFQQSVTSLTDFTNATTRRTVNALRSEFDTNYNTAKDATIDALMPEVNNPDLTMGKFQRGLTESMGDMFRKTNTLYNDVKADQTTIPAFSRAESALSKAPKIPELDSKTTPEAMKAYQDALNSTSENMQGFADRMGAAVKQPLTLKQVMGLWEESMSYLPKANNEERAIIRDFASGLYADTRSVLEKSNPKLLDQWDTAYQSWKKSTDVYESGVLNSLKSVGDVDTFVDKMLGKEMTRQEADAFMQAVGTNNKPVQDLFINSVLRKAKDANPADGAKIVRNFLDNWGDHFLSPQQSKMMDDVASFMDGNFDEFVLGMRQAQGLTDETAKDLLQGQTQLDIMKVVNDGRMDQIADKFTKLADSPELEKVISSFTPEEKETIGLSIAKGLFDEKLPVAALNQNGTYKVSPELAKTIVDTYTKVSESKPLQQILSSNQMGALKMAAEEAEKYGDLSEVPAAGWKKIGNGLIAMFYFARGWVPGGIRNAIEAAETSGEKELAYYGAVDQLIQDKVLKPNAMYTIGDLMKVVLPGAGQTASNSAQ